MEILLAIVGFFILAVLVSFGYAYLNDAETIDEEEEREVRLETPEERERARLSEAADEEKRRAEDIRFYSRTDGER